VGDALREHYPKQQLEYLDLTKSKQLIETMNAWLPPIMKTALSTIWRHAKRKKDWIDAGPRAIFRRQQTYEDTLRPSFLASFDTIRPQLTSNLP
jgi:hypothetical protein